MLREVSLYSNNSLYSYVHPLEKVLLLVLSLIVCSYTEKNMVLIFNILLFSIINIKVRNPFKIVCKFLFASSLFGFITAITLYLQSYEYKFILTILLRGISGGITIAFFALTTPINHIVYFMNKNEYTRDIGDIIKSMERFLIILELDFNIVFNAIKSRGGFSGTKGAIRDFGKGCAVVFRNMMIRWQEINLSLKNRSYSGRHNYSYEFSVGKIRLLSIFIYFCIMLILN